MKVIKRGYRRETEKITCPKCHSILEYEKDDIKSSSQYNQEEYWIVCPVCNGAIDVDYYNLFPWIDPVGNYEDR